MRSIVQTSIIVACCTFGCDSRHSSTIISEAEAESLPDNTTWRRTLTVAPGQAATFDFEKTTKGNGVLRFPGGSARIHDAHNDGVTFHPFTLRTRLVDLDGDGFADIEITGTAILYDEKGDREIGRLRVRAAFSFTPADSGFTQSVSSPFIYTSVDAPST